MLTRARQRLSTLSPRACRGFTANGSRGPQRSAHITPVVASVLTRVVGKSSSPSSSPGQNERLVRGGVSTSKSLRSPVLTAWRTYVYIYMRIRAMGTGGTKQRHSRPATCNSPRTYSPCRAVKPNLAARACTREVYARDCRRNSQTMCGHNSAREIPPARLPAIDWARKRSRGALLRECAIRSLIRLSGIIEIS